jgi:pimeloyl-ACP methyl ester carboxylesterase
VSNSTTRALVLLPGILMPASLRYQALIAALDDGVRALPKELEIYSGPEPPEAYSIETEIHGLTRFADAAGMDGFHLYGHSGGGAVAIAYATANPDRVHSLAVDEPAFDFTQEEKDSKSWKDLDVIAELPPAQRMPAFLRMQLRPGIEPPPRPEGPPPPWMANRPAGIEAFSKAARAYLIPDARFAQVRVPVYYSYGDLSSEEWEWRRDRLAHRFPRFTSELYAGCHHLNTSHIVEPARVAAALRELWMQSDTVGT